MSAAIIEKYGDARLPRYTSYPTAPNFTKNFDGSVYPQWLQALPQDEPTSLYVHIPFCRAMCWYCGCHTAVTQKDRPIIEYMETLHREVELLALARNESFSIGEIHFGGGTPTIMKPDEFVALVHAFRDRLGFAPTVNTAIEIDPRTLQSDMVAALAEAGVTRASLGVQSFDLKVQRAINRVQSVEQTMAAVSSLRGVGINAINFDLIYGLPHQTVESCIETVEAAVAMRPNRLAVFGYAHVPSFKKHQRLIQEEALPNAPERALQAAAMAQALIAAGYVQIGLDHFALPDDDLALAQAEGRLHRNFQGYTTDNCETLIGLGASSIGRLPQGYVQNEVPHGLYASRVASGELPIAKGYHLTAEDGLRAAIIERIMCDFAVDVEALACAHGFEANDLLRHNDRLDELESDGLIQRDGGRITISEEHRFIVRAAASAFDAYLNQAGRSFSKAA
ncbi:oxygen-independent coproporphyrinogen III oxidase [Rhizobium sp. NTR19]|uniref:Coproporphyrinogen-III oxidase n=1 Tax=Neorhizobium turbinariae TaxID=2937795 RepID=A0ABT0IQY8_9HYPH|nr:oxygen-independent coproporphyrinogen III oxidase [Neorhizobium turbinariae]MCK8780290.1 oxygen-independent coproporphyrinogen III oxidase [Neorhizobium turbinariae]